MRQPSIAIVDDDGSFRVALVEILLALGYGARGFASADEFIAQGGERLCDCVITDLHMPGMSGLDLLQVLSTRASTLPVIMITGRGDPGVEAIATAAGAVCLLKKPFETAALIECVRKALKA